MSQRKKTLKISKEAMLKPTVSISKVITWIVFVPDFTMPIEMAFEKAL